MKRIIDKKLFDLHIRTARQAIASCKYYRKIATDNKAFWGFAEDFLHQAEEQILMAELYIAG